MITGKELAKKILERIDARPETFYMGLWESQASTLFNWKTGKTVNECGTTHCVAGFAVDVNRLSGESSYQAKVRIDRELEIGSVSWQAIGRKLLGLDANTATEVFLDMSEAEAYAWLKKFAKAE